jgi:uncharacterized protein YjiS (DUF1127 family)
MIPASRLFSQLRSILHGHQGEDLQWLAGLPDRQLRDLGVRRIDIAAVVERETGRFKVDEFRSRGWIG